MVFSLRPSSLAAQKPASDVRLAQAHLDKMGSPNLQMAGEADPLTDRVTFGSCPF